MKINSLLEYTSPSSQPNQAGGQAPTFGRDPKVLEDDKLDETTTGSTSSGCVPGEAMPLGNIKRRGKGSIFSGIKTSEKFPNTNEGEIVPFKRKNPLTPSVITQLKALSNTALDLFWEGSYMPTAAQGQMAQLPIKEQKRLFDETCKRLKQLGYEHSIHEEDSDKLFLHSLAREAWYEAEKPPEQYNGLPDLIYDKETNKLSYYDLIGDDGYEYTDTTQFEDINEDELSEEQLLAKDLKKQLQLFQKNKSKELSDKPVDKEILAKENLHQWFKEKWVRFGPDGKIRGDCARGDDSEGKPKCLPQKKAQALGKKGRSYAASKKRREDPNPERSGKAINVATKKKKADEGILGKDVNRGQKVPDWAKGGIIGKLGMKLDPAWNDVQVTIPQHLLSKQSTEPSKELPTKTKPKSVEKISDKVKEDQLDELKCWPGHHRVPGTKAGTPGSCAKNESTVNEFVAPSGNGDDERSRRIRKLLQIAINVAEEQNAGKLELVHAMNVISKDDFFQVAIEGILPDITAKEYKWILQSAYNTVKHGDKLEEKWSKKYKASIDCSHPKGFSQKAHCAGRKKHNEDVAENTYIADFPDKKGNFAGDKHINVGGTFPAKPVVKQGSLVKASGLTGVYRVMDIRGDEAKIVQEIPNTGQSTYFPMSDLRVWTNKPVKEQGVAEGSLSEIDRRGFLKGMGAAAVAGAAGTGAYLNRGKGASGNFEGNDGVYVDQLLRVYAARKQMVKEPDDVINTCRALIQEYINQNPKMKQRVNSEYRLVLSHMTPQDYAEVTRNQDEIIKNFKLFLQGQDPIFKQKDEFESVSQGVAEEKCPHCNGPMFEETMMNEKKDACYYKVKSRYKVWPSAYASGALVKCRKSHGTWGNKSKK